MRRDVLQCESTDMAHLDLTGESRRLIQREVANAWHQRCTSLGLRKGTKGRQVQLEAFLQAALAALTAARIVSADDAARVGFLVLVDRGEELLTQWADYIPIERVAVSA